MQPNPQEKHIMTAIDTSSIPRIRDASRKIVRELGFMRSTMASTRLSPSAVHAVLEIGQHGGLTAVELSQTLHMEKSSVSRMLRKLIDGGEVCESASEFDGRVKILKLTAQGWETFEVINAYEQKQVASALYGLSSAEAQTVSKGLSLYARALGARRNAPSESLRAPVVQAVEIVRGYRPGAIGSVTEMHAQYYARAAGFGLFFEQKVATGLAEFSTRLDRPQNGLWLALQSGRIVGSIAIDGEDLGPGMAHLRWFIVSDSVRGTGTGNRLLSEALAFCDQQGFASTTLWTFQGLDAARHLYTKSGFALEEEFLGEQWGKQLTEQRFVRQCPVLHQPKSDLEHKHST